MGTRITSSGYIADGTITHAKLAADAVEHDKIKALTIVNADISATAAIAKTKLAALGIVDADISATAAIVGSKLAQNLSYAQTATTGIGINVSRDLAAADTDNAVVKIVNDNAGDNQPTLSIVNDAGGFAAGIYLLSTNALGIGLNVQNTANGAINTNYLQTGLSGGYPTLAVTRNLASANTDAAVTCITQANAGDDQHALKITQEGAGAWIEFAGKAVSTTKTAADEYIQVQTAGGVRYLRLYT